MIDPSRSFACSDPSPGYSPLLIRAGNRLERQFPGVVSNSPSRPWRIASAGGTGTEQPLFPSQRGICRCSFGGDGLFGDGIVPIRLKGVRRIAYSPSRPQSKPVCNLWSSDRDFFLAALHVFRCGRRGSPSSLGNHCKATAAPTWVLRLRINPGRKSTLEFPHKITSGTGPQSLPNPDIDIIAEVADRAVHQERMHQPHVVAAGRNNTESGIG